ncbi:MAG TPA: alpha/beta hydrolase [Chloroflexota bacterium]|nr:alpha/beta hydrolase [Chloroflexota bacterium]
MNLSTVSVHGDRFQIEVLTGGQGRPIVYLHDEYLPPAASAWLDDLATRARVIAPRHPGFGGSTGLEHLDDLLDLVVYYLDFLDTMDLRTVDVIGESFGGMIAAEVASLAPERVRRLVLVGSIGLWLDATPAPDPFAWPAADLHTLAWANPDGDAARTFLPDLGSDDEKRRSTLERIQSLSAAAKFIWPIPDKGLRKRIHRLRAPTLLLWGSEDRLVPIAYGQEFNKLIPGSQLVAVSGAGHFPLLENPADALGILRKFLDG